MTGRRAVVATALVALALGAGAGGRSVAVDVAADLSRERDLHGTEHVGSETCRRCHDRHYDSWHRTYHRTMTQTASERSVLGDFDGATLDYLGVHARMHRGDGGAFLITFDPPEGRSETVEVARTVGSHRYQQYLARRDDEYVRLPVAWHVQEGRWFHMNGAFLTPDPEPTRTKAYRRHVVRWNDNCVFCHNVAADPGLGDDGEFDTSVAELGVACEACHGPGAEHAARNASPWRRYALHLGEDDDPTIVNPDRLAPERSADVCGRCHGQRKTDRIERFLARGDPYVPGDDLALYSEPLWRDTTLDGEPGAFALRFWPDGTARLTAYEYQGLLQSPCAQRGEMTCTSCHGMHDGDPAGQIRPRAEGDAACTQCHEDVGPEHSGHPEASRGARCVGCHMPRIVYGLIGAFRSHRIEVPSPAHAARYGRPDACTLCHAERTREWAVDRMREMWPDARIAALPAELREDPDMPATLRALFGGDPIERAVAASALGRSETLEGEEPGARRLGALVDVMRHDPYPAVRRIAWRAARRLTARLHPDARVPWKRYRPVALGARRHRAVDALRRALPSGAVVDPDPTRVVPLRERARQVAIHIGE